MRGRERPPLSVIAYSATPDRIADGGDRYARACARCHGPNAASGGAISDLRYTAPATFDRFDDIVRRGTYVPLGMPAFDWFGDDDLDALRSYVLSRRDALMSASVE